MSQFYTNHQPRIEVEPSEVFGRSIKVYEKTETNDDFFHVVTGSISIAASVLNDVDGVRIRIMHRNVVLKLTKEFILAKAQRLTYKGEPKYYCPIELWVVESGDSNWAKGLKH